MGKKKYVILGVAGFVAERHLRAIRDNGGELIASCDPFDSVGVLDSYFPQSEFFTSESEFRLFCKDNEIDYTVICTPNYLHKSQAEFGLNFSNIICEKPVTLYPDDLEDLVDVELRTGHRVFTILQLRLNPVLQGLRCEIEQSSDYYDVKINYTTPRGRWYGKSWKGNPEKSGSLIFNIGIHLVDLMSWLFGYTQDIKLKTKTDKIVSGELFLKRAHITFNLSLDGVSSNRSMKIDGREIEFSRGFQDAHSHSYSKILAGGGFGLVEALPSIVLCDKIRKMRI
jgi:UDP-N-acetyl-2-amino-2-deoxyglucuronate dehydrogenase